MKQTRFFQHLNENDSTFQKVTTLDFIDNTGGTIMYYFKDGSKCSKYYIAPVNAETIDGFEFAEVSDPKNVWSLKKTVPEKEALKTAIGSDGVVYQAPTWEDYTQSHVSERKVRVDVIGKPVKIENYVVPSDSDYYFSGEDVETKSAPALTEKKESNTQKFDFNDTTSLKKNADYIEKPQTTIVETNDAAYIKNDSLHLDTKKLLGKTKIVKLHFNNNDVYELNVDQFIENAITPKTEKEVIKEVIKEKEVSSEDIDLEIDDIQKGLIDNMIDMSNKVEYSIDMELTLSLPPASVYKLIKTVYPAGMAKGFVNIIANRMQVKELKTAVAEGLMAFYDNDFEQESDVVEEPVEEEISQPKTTVKRASRTKKNA